MVLYIHVMLFFICLNFGLGLTTIPDTPLTLAQKVDPQTGQLVADQECFHQFQSDALIVPILAPIDPVTNPDLTGPNGVPDGIGDNFGVTGWTTRAGGPNLDQFVDDGTGSLILGNVTGGYNPITAAIEASYQAGETLKGVLLGGYITDILGSLAMQCNTDLSDTANYGTATVSPVMLYITYFVNIVFGLMLLLAVIYIITGKQFGI